MLGLFSLLLIILAGTFTKKSLCDHMFLCLMQLPTSGNGESYSKFMSNILHTTNFSKVATTFYNSTSNIKGLQFLYVLVNAWYCLAF